MTSEQLAWKICRHDVEMTHISGGSHIGAVLSVADIVGVLYADILRYRPEEPKWDGRDRLVMSKGHVVMEGTPKEVFSQTEKVRSLHLDVPQAAELRDELVKAGIPMPEGIIDTGACAQALYELLK